MAQMAFDNNKPLATVVIKKKKTVYTYEDFFLFELIKPTITGLTHAVVSDTGQCIAVGKLVEGKFETGNLITTGEIDAIYWR